MPERTINHTELFDLIRKIKKAPLTQAEVVAVNRILNGTPKPEQHKVSQRGIDLIHSFEQFRSNAYRDPGSSNGLPITIGWGSTKDENGQPVKLGDVWTKEKADQRFASDLEEFEDGVVEALEGAPTTQSQFDAMVSLAYNIGINAFRGSTLLRKHKAGDTRGAQAAFASWRLNDGKVMNGLVRRRAAEAALYGEN